MLEVVIPTCTARFRDAVRQVSAQAAHHSSVQATRPEVCKHGVSVFGSESLLRLISALLLPRLTRVLQRNHVAAQFPRTSSPVQQQSVCVTLVIDPQVANLGRN